MPFIVCHYNQTYSYSNNIYVLYAFYHNSIHYNKPLCTTDTFNMIEMKQRNNLIEVNWSLNTAISLFQVIMAATHFNI